MISKFIFSIAIVASVFFTGCSTSATEETAKPDVSLTNTYFKVVTLKGNEIEVFDKEPYIQFEAEGKVKGHLGCNSFFGSFTTEDKNISFENIGSTKMMCPNIKTEDAFTQVLQHTKAYEIKGETLTFFNTKGEKISVFEAVYF